MSEQMTVTDTLIDTTLAIANRHYYRAMFHALMDELRKHGVAIDSDQNFPCVLSEHEMTCLESAVYRARLLQVAPNISVEEEERAFRRASAEGTARLWVTILLDGLIANGFSLKRTAATEEQQTPAATGEIEETFDFGNLDIAESVI